MKLYACFFREKDLESQHEAAHRLLRFCLMKEYGIEEYSLGKGRHGKPYLENHPDVKINLSHCKGLAVCGTGNVPLGADCEGIREVRSGVVRRVCTETEKNEIENSSDPALVFTRMWTLKESFVKAVGRGISYPMRNVSFSFDKNNILTNVTGAFFRQYVLDGKYVISLCGAGNEQYVSLEIVSEKALRQ